MVLVLLEVGAPMIARSKQRGQTRTYPLIFVLQEETQMKKLCMLALICLGLTSIAAHGQLTDPIPEPITQDGGVEIRLVTVASGLTAPNWGISAPGDSKRLFVVDQNGILWAVNIATGDKSVFLDVGSRLVPLGAFGPGTFDERGFLGVAFHPRYERNGLLYTFTSEPPNTPPDFPVPGSAAANCHSVIIEWRVPFPRNPNSVVDPASARVLMRIAKPQFNHNGGAVNFGPDGMLYIATGDGGAADDQGPGHTAQGNGQDTSNLLGKILRINPRGNNAPNGQYSVPRDNPFAPSRGARGGQAGCLDGKCDEIYAFGFRNPFRFSFDRDADLLIAADVGQNDIEEVDVVVSGGNYGWRHKEGTFFFNPNGAAPGFVTDMDPGVPPGLIDPIAQYDHDEGIAIIGGFVYRGDDIRQLRGRYVFGEFARTFSSDGRLFHLRDRRDLDRGDNLREIREFRLVGQDQLGLSLLGLGEDAHGELYVLANGTGTPFGDTGVVLKIAPPRGDDKNDGQ